MKIRAILVDFGIPVIIIAVCAYLLVNGIDGEVKSIFTLAAGWAFRSGIKNKQAVKKPSETK